MKLYSMKEAAAQIGIRSTGSPLSRGRLHQIINEKIFGNVKTIEVHGSGWHVMELKEIVRIAKLRKAAIAKAEKDRKKRLKEGTKMAGPGRPRVR